jgi:hypothetical protein
VDSPGGGDTRLKSAGDGGWLVDVSLGMRKGTEGAAANWEGSMDASRRNYTTRCLCTLNLLIESSECIGNESYSNTSMKFHV